MVSPLARSTVYNIYTCNVLYTLCGITFNQSRKVHYYTVATGSSGQNRECVSVSVVGKNAGGRGVEQTLLVRGQMENNNSISYNLN